METHEALVHFINLYEKTESKLVKKDKKQLETSDDKISTFIDMLNKALLSENQGKVLWLIFRHGATNDFELMLEWINHGFATSDSVVKMDNFGQSQENLLQFMVENRMIDREKIENMIKTLKRREIGGYSDRPRKLLEFHIDELSKKVKKPNEHDSPPKKKKSLVDLLTHEKANEIIKGIKITHKNIKGKRLKLLLIALQELNLIPMERIAKEFHNCCREEFDWDIASYTAMNDYKYNSYTDGNELSQIKQSIETLIKSK